VDARGLPASQRYGDAYFGDRDAIGESRHVFIDGSALQRRLEAHRGDRFTLGELGFGTGLNFLLTWQAFDACARAAQRLHYVSIDRHPLRGERLLDCLASLGLSDTRARALASVLPPPVEGVHRRLLAGGRVVLDLYWMDVDDALEELARPGTAAVDAWYLDGFAPSRNSAMWSTSVFEGIARCSAPGATVATYSAAGSVRRGLAEAGFSVSKRPGFGRKRDSLAGTLLRRADPAPPTDTPWDLVEAASAPRTGDHALVFGAGLAGCHVAAALARRGWQVQVLDSGRVAGGASGNAQGLLFNRLSHRRSTLTDFSLAAQLFAHHLYRDAFDRGLLLEGRDGDLGGCLQTPPPRGDFAATVQALRDLPELATPVSAKQASERLGTRIVEDGLWHPRSGWLCPPRVCAALLATPGVEVIEARGPLQLRRDDAAANWQAVDAAGRCIARSGVAIIAAGSATRSFAVAAGLPLRVARGQTTQLPAAGLPPLRHALCHRGYIAPARDGEHCIGATFAPGDEDLSLRPADHHSNLEDLARALPDWAEALRYLDTTRLAGRAELRCVSPDYLPMIGPVADAGGFCERYGVLGRDARRLVADRGAYRPGLYLATAMGSRGLSYAALGGEIIASQLCGEPHPLGSELLRSVAPARFLIRAIVRGEAEQKACA
jgi:tRNA 5-methylaminomethyl-2-thiouridine biosynthesis bifunctional protein